MINRFSSVGYILESSLFSAILNFWDLFFLFFFSCLDSEFGIPSIKLGQSCLLWPSDGAEGTVFGVFVFFRFFFIAAVSPLAPPLGKASASSKTSLPGTPLEVGTGLLGFHGFALPVVS